jgi:hypothetical protein
MPLRSHLRPVKAHKIRRLCRRHLHSQLPCSASRVLEDTTCISSARNQRPAVLQKKDLKIVATYDGYSHHVITIALSPLIELRDEESIDFSAPNIETVKSGSGKLHSKVDIGLFEAEGIKKIAFDESESIRRY